MTTKFAAAALAGSFAAALTIVAAPATAQNARQGEVLRRVARRQERLRRRRRHHLRRHVQGRLPGQRLEVRRQGHLRAMKTPKGKGSLEPVKS